MKQSENGSCSLNRDRIEVEIEDEMGMEIGSWV